jgi:hypothetical protein
MTLAQLDPSAKAPWTKTTFFTGDAAAPTCDWSAPTVRAETPQIENTNIASFAFIFEATCFIALGKQAGQPAAKIRLALLPLSRPPGGYDLALGFGSIWFLIFIFVSGLFVVFVLALAKAPWTGTTEVFGLPARYCARVSVTPLVLQCSCQQG